jgi:hypothetical protein
MVGGPSLVRKLKISDSVVVDVDSDWTVHRDDFPGHYNLGVCRLRQSEHAYARGGRGKGIRFQTMLNNFRKVCFDTGSGEFARHILTSDGLLV